MIGSWNEFFPLKNLGCPLTLLSRALKRQSPWHYHEDSSRKPHYYYYHPTATSTEGTKSQYLCNFSLLPTLYLEPPVLFFTIFETMTVRLVAILNKKTRNIIKGKNSAKLRARMFSVTKIWEKLGICKSSLISMLFVIWQITKYYTSPVVKLKRPLFQNK